MSDETYHFIGLGGIGMSALARILLQKGVEVRGSDANESKLLLQLQKEGAAIQVGHSASFVKNGATVVYSTDIKNENVELAEARKKNLSLMHRSDMLDHLMRGKKALLVTGTHGKTTTSSLLASVLLEAGKDPSFVIGGILNGLNTNARWGLGPYFVAEADESDGSFLKTKSFGAIVTNLEDEHLNYWETPQKLDAAFAQFFRQSENPEHLFWCGDDERLKNLGPTGTSYGFKESNNLRIVSFGTTDHGIEFDLVWNGVFFRNVFLSLHGGHNALNGAAVFGLALSLGIPEEAIRKAFAYFSGAARRLEWKGTAHAVDMYDDYGHHPTEIGATLSALRGKVREKRIVAIFQPHRYSRVRDLFDGFADCFKEADLVILTDIYSAGEAPINGISTASLYVKMRSILGDKLHFFPRAHLEEGAARLLMPHDVAITIGAGDVTQSGEPILLKYAERAPKWNVAVLFGGTSAEHDVSLMSARRIASGLDLKFYNVKFFGITKTGQWISGPDAIDKLEQKVPLPHSKELLPPHLLQELLGCDVALPVFHGPQGEDGMFQGFLDVFNIPYAGCDYRTGALTMHKGWTKHIAVCSGVPTAPYMELDSQTYQKNPELILQRIENFFNYPVWIKPVHLGSSIGVSRAANSLEALKAVDLAFSYDDAIIVEKEIQGIQVEYAVMGNEFLRVAKSCEILNLGFHDFASKYGPAASGMAIPARITPTLEKLGESLALSMYRATGCKGMARVDFFVDTSGYFWLNEINPFPGYTATSAYPSMWEQSGLNLAQQCDQMIILAFQRHRRLATIRTR